MFCLVKKKYLEMVFNYLKFCIADDMSLLFVVGGHPDLFKCEVVDLSGQERTCQNISDFPLDARATGSFVAGGAFACGGITPPTLRPTCYSYNLEYDIWDIKALMNTGKVSAAGVMYNSSHWWITGGFVSGSDSKFTELLNVNTMKFSGFVDLPIERTSHNLIRINDSHIMMVGHCESTNQAWMFNQMNEVWTELPNSLESRDTPFAGLVTYANGSQIVILAGGYHTRTAEAFSLQEENWFFIPDLPIWGYELYDGSFVPFGDTFLIVGGEDYGSGGVQNSIIQFDPFIDNWIIRKEKLKLPKYFSTSFFVPDDYVVCT